MKKLLIALIAVLAIASVVFGLYGHPVLACIAGYSGVTLLFLTVWHYSRKPVREYEARRGLEAHGCYEQPED